jgi:SAM-dependent methyltransferase
MGHHGQEQSLYADPAVYDILYTPGTAQETDALQEVEKALSASPLQADRLWLEPACGTGRYLRTAARRGRTCVGFDRDPGQLEYARSRQPRVTPISYFQADMIDFRAACGLSTGVVDFACNPVNSLRHLSTDVDMLAHFQQMAEVLKPGGIYVVGISLLDEGGMLPEEDLWVARRGSCQVSQLVNYLPPEPGTRMEKVISHLTVTRPRGSDHFDDSYDLRTYTHRQWLELIGRSALRHLGSFDAKGRPTERPDLPYQLEALGCS